MGCRRSEMSRSVPTDAQPLLELENLNIGLDTTTAVHAHMTIKPWCITSRDIYIILSGWRRSRVLCGALKRIVGPGFGVYPPGRLKRKLYTRRTRSGRKNYYTTYDIVLIIIYIYIGIRYIYYNICLSGGKEAREVL